MKYIKLLAGKKTYIVSAVSVLLGVLQLFQGHNYTQVLPYILAGGFGGALRAAIGKIEARIDAVVNHYLPAPIAEVVDQGIATEVNKVEGVTK